MFRLLTFRFLALAPLLVGCAHDRNEATRRDSDSHVPKSVIISNQCAVFRLPTGYVALFITKDSPKIYYGAYFSERGTFGGRERPTADGIVEGSGSIVAQGIKIHLRSVGEFDAEVSLADSDDIETGIALGRWMTLGDVHADQLTYMTNRGIHAR
jgi:hypothetical protein